MLIDEHDRPFVRWAMEKAYTFDYCRPSDLPEPCLRVRLGLSTACFHRGKLVYWSAESPGEQLDQLLYEMMCLFSVCSREHAYLNRHVFISPPKQISFKTV
jgi:hypothetical protein